MRRDARERPPLADRLARPGQIKALQIAQAAVDGPQMIERGAAAEIVALDERHRQTALRCIVRNRQPVNPAADDQHVERRSGQTIEVTHHGGHPVLQRCSYSVHCGDDRGCPYVLEHAYP